MGNLPVIKVSDPKDKRRIAYTDSLNNYYAYLDLKKDELNNLPKARHIEEFLRLKKEIEHYHQYPHGNIKEFVLRKNLKDSCGCDEHLLTLEVYKYEPPKYAVLYEPIKIKPKPALVKIKPIEVSVKKQEPVAIQVVPISQKRLLRYWYHNDKLDSLKSFTIINGISYENH